LITLKRAPLTDNRGMNDARHLAFFCPDVTETSTLTRARQFIDYGYEVTVFGFRRERYNMAYQPEWPHVPLGVTADGKYWQRVRALVGALPALLANRATLRRATVFYARNIDQLLLAFLARLIVLSRAPVAYEVLDVPPILFSRGLRATFLRIVERFCLSRTRVLVLSSPGFHRGYYAAVQKYRGAWFLLENKLHPSVASLAARVSTTDKRTGEGRNRPWVVGYFGLIRGEETFALMTRLADRLKDRVIFRFRGVLTTVDQSRFDATLRERPNMAYGGPYLPYHDFEELYRGIDFAWALDLEHADHNSRWLLPCRFYEAGYFGVPCLAVHGFEVGSLLERHRIGWTFDAPLEDSLVRFFETVTRSDYDHVRDRLRNVPTETFVASDDIARLSAILNS
jgi:succinoglycan biosynthesis protein ExoL